MRADCTWGEGPPVMISLDGSGMVLNEEPSRGGFIHGVVSSGSADLTIKEAIDLSIQLTQAAQAAEDLEAMCVHHDEEAFHGR